MGWGCECSYFRFLFASFSFFFFFYSSLFFLVGRIFIPFSSFFVSSSSSILGILWPFFLFLFCNCDAGIWTRVKTKERKEISWGYIHGLSRYYNVTNATTLYTSFISFFLLLPSSFSLFLWFGFWFFFLVDGKALLLFLLPLFSLLHSMVAVS